MYLKAVSIGGTAKTLHKIKNATKQPQALGYKSGTEIFKKSNTSLKKGWTGNLSPNSKEGRYTAIKCGGET